MAASRTAPGPPLRLLGVTPAPGSGIKPRTHFLLHFSRRVDPRTITESQLRCEYPDPRATFVGDPFRLVSLWLEPQGDAVSFQPPELLLGREVRLIVGDGILAEDGAPLERDPRAPPGAAHAFTWRVLEMPPP